VVKRATAKNPALEADPLVSEQLQLYPSPPAAGKRKSPNGVTTSDLICTACLGLNEDLFPRVMELHVPAGAIVADVTYGLGIFWKKVPESKYRLLATDIKTGVDCRRLPYEDGSIDCVVLDPPYMEGLFRRSASHLAGAGSYAAFRDTYSNGEGTTTGPKYHESGPRPLLPRWARGISRVAQARGVDRQVPGRSERQHPAIDARGNHW